MGQAFDNLRAPPMLLLSGQDVPADLPVQAQHFGVDRQRRALLRTVDPSLELDEPLAVAFRWIRERRCRLVHVCPLLLC